MLQPVMKPASSAARNDDAARDLVRAAETADRDLRQDLGFEHVLRHRLHHLGGDVAGRDGVDGDALARRLPGPAPW